MRHVGTSPGIWDDIRETSGSNANGRWRKMPDGNLEQTGEVTLSNGAATITFPVPFPNACTHITLTSVAPGQATSSSVTAWLATEPSASKTSATVNGRAFATLLGVLSINVGSFNVAWRAVGY